VSLDSERNFASLHRLLVLDGDDPFMTGHQPRKDRARPGGISRYIPEWTKSDQAIYDLLLHSFPHWHIDPEQYKRAGIWLRTIYLYYRLRIPASLIAKQMGDVGVDAIRNRLRMIRNAAKGLNTAGKPRRIKTGDPKAASVKRGERRRTNAKLLGGLEDMLTPKGHRLDADGVKVRITWKRVRDKNRDRVIPDWVKDRQSVIDILKTAFPGYWTKTEHLEQARRWYQIIHYYYRKKATRKETARLMGLTDTQVRGTLEKISRVQAGKNTAGRTRRQSGPGNLSSLDTSDVYADNLRRHKSIRTR